MANSLFAERFNTTPFSHAVREKATVQPLAEEQRSDPGLPHDLLATMPQLCRVRTAACIGHVLALAASCGGQSVTHVSVVCEFGLAARFRGVVSTDVSACRDRSFIGQFRALSAVEAHLVCTELQALGPICPPSGPHARTKPGF